MNAMNDDELRDALARRASRSLSSDDRNDVIRAARVRALEPRRRSFAPHVAGWLAAAVGVVVLVLVVAPILLSPPTQVARPSQSPIAASSGNPNTSLSPSGQIHIYSAQELSGMIGDPRWVGKTVLALAQIDPVYIYGQCPPPDEPCISGALSGVSGKSAVYVGWRDATASDGVPYDDGSGYRWIRMLGYPTVPGMLAFTIRADSAEYLGMAQTAADNAAFEPTSLVGNPSDPEDTVAVVSGWLTHTLEAPCAFPQQGLQSPMPDISSYYCGGSWLTNEPASTPTSGLTIDGGLHVQSDAYNTFAVDPQPADGGGYQPRQGIYLVRNAGCPEVVTGDCPVWRMVGRLDGASTPFESPTPTLVVTPTPLPFSPAPTTPASEVSYVHLDQALALAQQQVGPGYTVRSYAPGHFEEVVQILFGPWAADFPPPGAATTQSMVWGVMFAKGSQLHTVYIDVFDGTVLGTDERPAPNQLAKPHKSDITFAPPTIVAYNGTDLDVSVYVADELAATIPAHGDTTIDPTMFGPAPWSVTTKTSTGRQLTTGVLDPATVWGTTGDYPLSGQTWLERIDLSCGRLDLWSGGEASGPAPGPSFPPNDCVP